MIKKTLSILVVLFTLVATMAFGGEMQRTNSKVNLAIVAQETNCSAAEYLIAMEPSVGICSGDYGCSGGVRYKCMFDNNDRDCKWQSTSDSCSSSDRSITPDTTCK